MREGRQVRGRCCVRGGVGVGDWEGAVGACFWRGRGARGGEPDEGEVEV